MGHRVSLTLPELTLSLRCFYLCLQSEWVDYRQVPSCLVSPLVFIFSIHISCVSIQLLTLLFYFLLIICFFPPSYLFSASSLPRFHNCYNQIIALTKFKKFKHQVPNQILSKLILILLSKVTEKYPLLIFHSIGIGIFCITLKTLRIQK
jgi:hypothetical protein